MKTNSVKKGSEKNIEMFQMSNEELVTINGGRYDLGVDEDGNTVIIWRPGIFANIRTFLSRF